MSRIGLLYDSSRKIILKATKEINMSKKKSAKNKKQQVKQKIFENDFEAKKESSEGYCDFCHESKIVKSVDDPFLLNVGNQRVQIVVCKQCWEDRLQEV